MLRPAGLLTIEKGVPNLTGLFSLQNVTPIHVAPAVWLGLHWKGLRGEAVAAGMITGGATCYVLSCLLLTLPAMSLVKLWRVPNSGEVIHLCTLTPPIPWVSCARTCAAVHV